MKRKAKILTENELLQDSPNNYMSESQLKFFKNRLESLANELLQNADETTEHLRRTSLVPDPAEFKHVTSWANDKIKFLSAKALPPSLTTIILLLNFFI